MDDLFKNINWNVLSLDSLLDFILTDCKLLMNSQELKEILIEEFRRRFLDDVESQPNDKKLSKERSLSIMNRSGNQYNNVSNHSQIQKQLNNSTNSHQLETIFQSTRKNQHYRNYVTKIENRKISFTNELVTKLISIIFYLIDLNLDIASKYENINPQRSNFNSSSVKKNEKIHYEDTSISNQQTSTGLFKNISQLSFFKTSIEMNNNNNRGILSPSRNKNLYNHIKSPVKNARLTNRKICDSEILSPSAKNKNQTFTTFNLINTSFDFFSNSRNCSFANDRNKNFNNNAIINDLTESYSPSRAEIMNHLRRNDEKNKNYASITDSSKLSKKESPPIKNNVGNKYSNFDTNKKADLIKLIKSPERNDKVKSISSLVGNLKKKMNDVMSNIKESKQQNGQNVKASKNNVDNIQKSNAATNSKNLNNSILNSTLNKKEQIVSEKDKITIKKFTDNTHLTKTIQRDRNAFSPVSSNRTQNLIKSPLRGIIKDDDDNKNKLNANKKKSKSRSNSKTKENSKAESKSKATNYSENLKNPTRIQIKKLNNHGQNPPSKKINPPEFCTCFKNDSPDLKFSLLNGQENNLMMDSIKNSDKENYLNTHTSINSNLNSSRLHDSPKHSKTSSSAISMLNLCEFCTIQKSILKGNNLNSTLKKK